MDVDLNTPSEELAQRITARLVREKLILQADAGSLATLLAEAKARDGDWRLALEKALGREKKP